MIEMEKSKEVVEVIQRVEELFDKWSGTEFIPNDKKIIRDRNNITPDNLMKFYRYYYDGLPGYKFMASNVNMFFKAGKIKDRLPDHIELGLSIINKADPHYYTNASTLVLLGRISVDIRIYSGSIKSDVTLKNEYGRRQQIHFKKNQVIEQSEFDSSYQSVRIISTSEELSEEPVTEEFSVWLEAGQSKTITFICECVSQHRSYPSQEGQPGSITHLIKEKGKWEAPII